MVRVYADSHDEADAIWRRLHLADEPALASVEVWVDGSPVALLRCAADGLLAPHAAQPRRS